MRDPIFIGRVIKCYFSNGLAPVLVFFVPWVYFCMKKDKISIFRCLIMAIVSAKVTPNVPFFKPSVFFGVILCYFYVDILVKMK